MNQTSKAAPPSPENLSKLLEIHRRALLFGDAQRDADAMETIDDAYRNALREATRRPLPSRLPRIVLTITNPELKNPVSSIDRVVLSVLAELGRLPLQRIQVTHSGNEWFEVDETGAGSESMQAQRSVSDRRYTPHQGDLILILNLDLALRRGAFERLVAFRRQGARVFTFIHDIFLLTHPEWFGEGEILGMSRWLSGVLTVSDKLIANSQSTARQLMRWQAMQPAKPQSQMRRVPIAVTGLGSDAVAADGAGPNWSASEGAADFSVPPGTSPLFLTVAAIHPRKGIDTLVNGFNALWRQGVDVRLVLSGRTVNKSIAEQIRKSPELGSRLFFPGFLSDAQLRDIAACADALIVPSREEGFGLPLAEAVALDLPVIARDIPVFREIAGGQPFYFGRGPGRDLPTRMRRWLELPHERKRTHIPTQAAMRWEQVVRQFIVVMTTDLQLGHVRVALQG